MKRNSIFAGAAVLALSVTALAMPASAKATMHHHRHHMAAMKSDSNSEEQQTAQLNQQQLGNPGGMSSGNAMGGTAMSGGQGGQKESMTHNDNGGQINNANAANGNNTATAPH